jgi:hypothetical protein
VLGQAESAGFEALLHSYPRIKPKKITRHIAVTSELSSSLNVYDPQTLLAIKCYVSGIGSPPFELLVS